jgi:hypothetical protein
VRTDPAPSSSIAAVRLAIPNAWRILRGPAEDDEIDLSDGHLVLLDDPHGQAV